MLSLRRTLNLRNLNYATGSFTRRRFASRVQIGDIWKEISEETGAKRVNIPQKYYKLDKDGNPIFSTSTKHHLRWMMQKDILKQDVFLLGKPGPQRRQLAMQYLQLTNREVEYLAVTRDSTESDLKQRREIINGSSVYFDQSAVRAAKEGRILVLEGIEKAERNVLPVLNNLLENREMHLEDGRLLIPAERYDKLLESNSKEVLDKWGLIRVSEDFRVISLGLPVPKYRGNPLDPPLRSRFQARDISTESYQELLEELKHATDVSTNNATLENFLSFAFGINSVDQTTAFTDFPTESLKYVARIYAKNPYLPIFDGIYRLYPYRNFVEKESRQNIENLLKSLDIKIPDKSDRRQEILEVSEKDCQLEGVSMKKVKIKTFDNETVEIEVPSSSVTINDKQHVFIPNAYHENTLADLVQSYAVSDFCLIGPRGSGKSALIYELCRRLGQHCEVLMLYQDMTARDLVQQRTTKVNGDTVWRDSALVKAALNGHTIVLDGIHRLHNSTIAILHRLIHDREIQLYCGKRLIAQEKYDELLKDGILAEEMEEHRVYPIHPAFRIVALAEPPTQEQNWLTPEMLSLFLFHEIRNLSKKEEEFIITEMYGPMGNSLKQIIDFAQFLRESRDPVLKSLSGSLSTRQLLKIAQRYSKYDPENDGTVNSVYETLNRTFLTQFLPSLPRKAFENALSRFNIEQTGKDNLPSRTIEVTDTHVKIGKTEILLSQSDASKAAKIPNILFYDIPEHVALLEHILQDFLLGSHLLLVGNQGVGKNKLADRFLQLLKRPREYIQLHRDTTVQTLTLQPSVRDGVIVHEDSPLVKAVKEGHVLMIDEADKSPTHVTCILKTLVENGEMYLSDGRKIVPHGAKKADDDEDQIIETHPDFRMIVLANRPGFPFLGNDFFGALGDCFSAFAVDNPSISSEVKMLRQYGPDVPLETIQKLVEAFSELRTMADQSQLAYPYSTREVVNIVKHLQQFRDEDVAELIGNVLDFDRHSPESFEQVTNILLKHGLQIGAYAEQELAAIRRKREMQVTVSRVSGLDTSAPKHGKVDPNNDPHVGGNTWAGGTGGRDTAGLGGKGGPYRLDAGHKVHQLSDAEKDDIPEHVKRAAREMNRKAFEAKLKEIQMSKYDHKIYEQFSVPVRQQVQILRIILNSLQAKSKERQWLRHQTSGELDDIKLIEGLTGEKNIYKRRMEQDPEPGQPQEKPKRLKLVVDVSGSMYRFNGYDGRLDRELEAVVMVMEAFDGFEKKIKYDVVGHSGESYCVPFVDLKNPPDNDKLRLETIRMMHAHSQYCWSGDNTINATKHAIKELAKEDCDEALVVVLSDANLARYGISPKRFGEALMTNPKVQAYVVFIGSLDKEAEIIKREMPAGRSFICMDTKDLPQIMKTIFESSVLK
ncbi:von Willebrand factor A domain-containing protein 8 [Culicoides brevitarsis]|uniref:von Willebrand factor A domain-containing protein 8 n=1 Tax=Culicoides brevitarsis TaxID=469753 RepID=UPI00307CAFD6